MSGEDARHAPLREWQADAPVIREVAVRLLPTRLEHGLAISGLTLAGERPLPVVRVRTGDADGYGEAPPLATFTGQSAEDTRREVADVAPSLVGLSVAEALDLLHVPPHALDGRPLGTQARCALDVALHDAAARAVGRPLDALLGARRQGSIRISRAIGYHDLPTTLRLARGYQDHGIEALKLKVGRDVRTDADTIRAVRAEVGPEVELAIDANAGYDTADAVALVEAVRDADLAYFEQPVGRHDLAGLHAVRDAGLRVMADESAFDAADVARLAEARSADLVAIKLIKCGGLRPALEVVRAARRHGLLVTVIDPLGSAVSLHAGLALAATLPEHGFAHGLSAGLDVTAPYAPHRPLTNGRLPVGDAPGLGVEVRWEEEEPPA